MKKYVIGMLVVAGLLCVIAVHVGKDCANDTPLGLPPVPYPEDNPQTPEKIALGKKLFDDKRFSSTGTVACANCHLEAKAFTDGPLLVSEGIEGLKGTRNAPTVVNSV